MTDQNLACHRGQSRRGFIKNVSWGLAAAAASVPRVHAAEGPEMEIKIGLIGCGGRGTGAVLDAMGAATKVIYPQTGYHTEDVADGATIERKNIQVVALADLFEDRLARCHQQLQRLGVHVSKDRCFLGFDAYQQVLAIPEINYIILATPPHFRPAHLMAAVQAGKHVFAEKPFAVDVPGVRMVMQAGELAQQKSLGIAGGTQRRHMPSYQETIQRIHDGAIGEVVYAKCYWNGGQIWVIDRQDDWSDVEWQLRNWNYFTWLSGDHIVEQHVHNLDIMNWVLGTHPTRAVSGLGGRQVRTGDRHGHIYDHFAIEFEYPGGISVFSQRWRFREREPSPYQQTHQDLIDSILRGKPLNEAQANAEATMTGILGREAVYSGQAIDWEKAMQSELRLGPDQYALGPYPMPPVPLPGIYRFA
jgi:myo-inositol 2-dehydrogenase / D-chiro-inositol 1-dehydrogenase